MGHAMEKRYVKQFCQMVFAVLLLVGAFQPVSATELGDTDVTETEEIAGDSLQDTEENFDVPAASSEPVSSQEPLPSMTPEVIETPAPSAIPEDNQDSTVIVESWSFDSDVLVYDNEKYVLNLSASLDSSVTRDTVSSMLPSHVLIQDGSAVPLTWDLAQIPEEGITGDGTFVVFGTLPDGYVLAEGVNAVEVQLVTVGVEELAVDDEKYLVGDAVSPGGTVINLFDYWVGDERYAVDTGISASNSNSGINQEHNLKFFSNADDNKYINSWTAGGVTGGIKNGIVKNVLGEDGYPILSPNYSIDKTNGDSLNYLFNSSSEATGQPGKAAYMDVKGLLQSGYAEDNEYNGYYYYDAQKNFAVFDENENAFEIYNTWGVKNGGGLADSSNGQFFPFNDASDVFDERNNSLVQKEDIYGSSQSLHHLFGLSMTSRFIQQNGGKNNGKPVIYEFSGDDDVWIFIDGVLVGDLGGVHNHAEISIDFSTGDIEITQYPVGQSEVTKKTTILDQFINAGKYTSSDSGKWSGNTFANDTYHTLNFFYLERGGGASNMKLKYNLVTIPESSIVKVDQTGDKIEGAGFELKIRSKNDNAEEVVASGTTNANGTLVLLNPETKLPIGLNDLRTKYDEFKKNHYDAEIVLYEKTIPPGYRGIQEIPLYFVEDEKVEEEILLVKDYWSNGSYAMPQVTTTLKSTVNYYDSESHNNLGTISLTEGNNQYDGKLFAVVLKKTDDEWRPISGTYEEGYTVAENGNMSSVIQAAKVNWYPFQLTNSTAYEVNVTELPGDITRYYHFDQTDRAEYAVGYYYTKADSPAEISESNTYPIYYPGLTGSENNIDKRVFSSRIYVPNIKNRIIVQKLDDQNDGYYVAGAKFNLYKEDQVEQTNGSYQLKADASPYDTCTTSISMLKDQKVDLIGANSFPTAGKTLDYGTYFIQEAPLGEQSGYTIVHKDGQGNIVSEAVPSDAYMVNPALVKVVVDETGIYAYAGDTNVNDGVDVQYGVGAIVRSMLRFAEKDDIDTTLHDIIASLMTNNSGATAEPSQLTYEKDENQGELDLAYNASSALYEYGPVEAGGKTAFTVDSGWAKVMIQQCQNELHRVPTSSDFHPLDDTDLSNLFSRSVIVRVKNQSAGELKLTNEVVVNERQQAYKDQDFQFNLQLDATGLGVAFDAALPQTITAKISGTDKVITLTKNGNVYSISSDNHITLSDGQSIVFEQLPKGIKFAVSEVEDTSFVTNVASKIVSMVNEEQVSTDGAIDESPSNPANGIKPQSGIIQRFNRTEVAYTNTTTEFVFYKVDSTGKPGEKGDPLSGAVFALYKLNDNLDIDYTNYSDTLLETDASGQLINEDQKKDWTLIETKVISGSSIKDISTVTSDANGIVSFSGIPYDAKEFRLVELTAPPGYTVPTGQWRIICDGDKSFKPIKDVSAVKNPPAIESINQEQDSEDPIKYQIRNYKPQDLPSSGNTGIGWFMKTGGALMISSALFIFFLAQRRKKQDLNKDSQE